MNPADWNMQSELPPIVRQFSAEFPETRRIRAHDEIYAQEDDEPVLLFVTSGIAVRVRTMRDGDSQIIGIVVPGDIVDTRSEVHFGVDHSITAITDCVIGCVRRADIERFLNGHREIARLVEIAKAADLSICREWVVGLGQRDTRARIAHLICELFYRLRRVGLVDGNTIPWPLTQAQIGMAVAASVVHTNRCLQELRRLKLIELSNGEMRILNWPALVELADFTDGYLEV